MNVTVFSATNCGICHAVMQWLDKQGISYDKKVVDTDESAMDDFMATNEGMIGTPFTVIENNGVTTKIAGFDQPKFKTALDL
jgi:glutaredoxin